MMNQRNYFFIYAYDGQIECRMKHFSIKFLSMHEFNCMLKGEADELNSEVFPLKSG
jgi:hypothetical protein